MLRKLRSSAGESMAEVMIAILVAAFALLILANMLIASRKIIAQSSEHEKKRTAEKSSVETFLATGEGDAADGAVTVRLKGADPTAGSKGQISVKIYTSDADDGLYAYIPAG